jgi:hypothetical protein
MKIGRLLGYDAPVTSLPVAGWVAGASNPTYGEFNGKLMTDSTGKQGGA